MGDWDRHIHTTIYRTDSKNLLYRTGNSTQFSVMAFKGKALKKRVGVCVCTTDSLCCTPETNIAL